MKENSTQILEDLRALLSKKRNEYIDASNKNEIGSPYYLYCKGKIDLINDMISYLSEKI